jgi:hypothetical protein
VRKPAEDDLAKEKYSCLPRLTKNPQELGDPCTPYIIGKATIQSRRRQALWATFKFICANV